MTHQMSSAMFRAIAGVCRTMVVANTGGSLALLIIFMLGGFIIPRTQIKPWWIWGYWCSPLSYAESSITVNEFLAPRWAKVGCSCREKESQSTADFELRIDFFCFL
jgi:ABC-type multidrug transport system permease subunit